MRKLTIEISGDTMRSEEWLEEHVRQAVADYLLEYRHLNKGARL